MRKPEFVENFLAMPANLVRRLRGIDKQVSYSVRYESIFDFAHRLVFYDQGGFVITEEFRPMHTRVEEIALEFPNTNPSKREELVAELEVFEKVLKKSGRQPGNFEASYVVGRTLIFPPIRFERFRRMAARQELGEAYGDDYSSDSVISLQEAYDRIEEEVKRGRYSYRDLFTNRKQYKRVGVSFKQLCKKAYEEARARELAGESRK